MRGFRFEGVWNAGLFLSLAGFLLYAIGIVLTGMDTCNADIQELQRSAWYLERSTYELPADYAADLMEWADGAYDDMPTSSSNTSWLLWMGTEHSLHLTDCYADTHKLQVQ